MHCINYKRRIEHFPVVATIGFFDGVHLGHHYLIDQVQKIALAEGLPSAVITFPVHPRKVMNQEYQPALLCSYEEKIIRLASTKVDYCISMDFTQELSMLTAREFIQKILKEQLHVRTLVVGYDHRFGHNREDGFEEYKKYGAEVGINVVLAKQYEGEHISATRIRALLSEGDVEKAAHLLTYNYILSGKIVEGYKVGRTIGFPTANVESWERYKVVPAFGVYAVHVYIEGEKHDGMLYIGKRPTLHNGQNISVEVNIFDFEGDLYNKSISVEFLEFTRPDEKFPDVESLKAQLFRDRDMVLEVLKKHKTD